MCVCERERENRTESSTNKTDLQTPSTKRVASLLSSSEERERVPNREQHINKTEVQTPSTYRVASPQINTKAQ